MFGDYISREAAIISLTGMFLDKSKDYCAACKAIERLHAADVRENVMGEWIDMLDSELFVFKKCSLCGETGVKTMNFCPNCGADMRGKE